MDVQEETMDSKNIFKGKRTKRQRTTMSPFLLTMSTTTSCSSGEATVGGGGGGFFSDLTTSPSDSVELTTQSSVELEQDMANCLILLAQGQSQKSSSSKSAVHHELFQCKTCDRCFPSFQALGGHRASHKKPKPVQEEKNSTNTNNNAFFLGHQESSTVRLIKDDDDTTLSLRIQSSRDLCGLNNNNFKPSRVHECSICGAEFSSGQALGGHMRRHRPLPVVASRSRNDEGSDQGGGVKKTRTILSLDLNLPAPDQIEDDQLVESRNPFASKEQVIVFKASHPLVHCHY